MKPLLDIISAHRAGVATGIFSVCSAHPLVIEAAFRHALDSGAPFALVEATSNQVNQFGGYTGMTPPAFRNFVFAIADRVGLDRGRVLLGGDHLGPNTWQGLPAEEAMANAETMIRDYVVAGFRKIHLDCSMSCACDPVPLTDAIVAERAARLCAVAEAAAGAEPPVYVIGTEVPVPGGAHETLDALAVTSPEAARETLSVHRRVFAAHGLDAAWQRVVALVVQPGVEFDHDKVIRYDPAKARDLSALAPTEPNIVFEAHSTDYQPASALQSLVHDHFAILKVGPGVTFALREALWGLDAIEREWLGAAASGFRERTLAVMRADPTYWRGYYHYSGAALEIALQYSLSDRIRYYWPVAAVEAARTVMFDALTANPPPLPLVSQYLPVAFARLREAGHQMTPHALVMAHIGAVLDDYHAACSPPKGA